MILIFILSSIPGDDSTKFSAFFEQINPKLQNLLHVPLFAGLTMLWSLSLANSNLNRNKVLLYTFLICWGYSLIDEFHQFFVPGRYPGFIDVMLNTIGIIAALILFFHFERKLNENIISRPSVAVPTK